MKDSQPAWMLEDRYEHGNAEAVRRLLEDAPQPRRLVEFFGGMGEFTKVLADLYPGVGIHTWDLDSRCVKTLKKIPGTIVYKGDSTEEAEVESGDGVLMDWNVFTLKRAREEYLECLDYVFGQRPLWVEITDSAYSKIHLNYQAYGVSYENRYKDYRKQMRKWGLRYGYRLARWEQPHNMTVMYLFERNKKPRRSKRGTRSS